MATFRCCPLAKETSSVVIFTKIVANNLDRFAVFVILMDPAKSALWFRDAYKRDTNCAHISSRRNLTADCTNWQQAVWSGMRKAVERRNDMWMEKRVRWREKRMPMSGPNNFL